MIEFGNTTIRNFMAISLATINLSGRGLVLIEGENLQDASAQSNGAGKSSLVDAVAWVLYGITARGVTGDAVVNRKAGRDCSVTMDFTVDGQQWLIERGRKDKALKNRVRLSQWDYLTGAYVDRTLGTDKLTQERIDALLGCNAKTFSEAVYMGQEAMPDLPTMTDKALKATLEQAMNIDRLDDALDIAKERCETAQHAYDSSVSFIAVTQADIERVEEEIENESNRVLSLTADYTKMAKEKADLYKDYKEKQDEVNRKLEYAEEALEEAVRQIPAVCSGQPQSMIDKRKELLEISRKIQKVDEMLADVRARDTVLAREIAALGSTGCTACGRKFDNADDIVEHHTAKTNERVTLEAEKVKLRAAHDKLASQEAKVQKAYDQMTHDNLSEKYRAEAAVSVCKTTVNAYRARKAEIEDERKTAVQRLERWIALKMDEVKEAKARGEKADAKYQALLSEIAVHRANAVEREARLNVMLKVKHVLSRKGFRGEVLDQITPYLNARTQYYLTWLTSDNITATWNTLTQNSAGDFVESFHIDVTHRDGAESFAGLSGGEKRKVRLATAMALQDLVGTRAVKPIKLFVADEIDDAIDDAGLELLMGLLEEKAKSVGTLLIISHNSLADWCKESITMVKQDGQTTIK